VNQDIINLRHFISIHKNLKEMEKTYIKLEEFNAPDLSSFFFDSYLDLNENLENIVNINNLTDKKVEAYKKLNSEIYNRLKYDYPHLYNIGVNITDVFYESYEIMENSIKSQLKIYDDGERPFFASGFSFFELYIPRFSLLDFMLTDGLCSMENFSYDNGKISINISGLNKEFNLTGQEYKIYGNAYSECIKFINKKLNLNGTVDAYID